MYKNVPRFVVMSRWRYSDPTNPDPFMDSSCRFARLDRLDRLEGLDEDKTGEFAGSEARPKSPSFMCPSCKAQHVNLMFSADVCVVLLNITLIEYFLVPLKQMNKILSFTSEVRVRVKDRVWVKDRDHD